MKRYYPKSTKTFNSIDWQNSTVCNICGKRIQALESYPCLNSTIMLNCPHCKYWVKVYSNKDECRGLIDTHNCNSDWMWKLVDNYWVCEWLHSNKKDVVRIKVPNYCSIDLGNLLNRMVGIYYYCKKKNMIPLRYRAIVSGVMDDE